jgi:tetratricopeptide (TPR) repeat protein
MMSDDAEVRVPSAVVMHADARDSGRVYQAGRDQHIYQSPAPIPERALRTLPRDAAYFTGRETELRHVHEAVATASGAGLAHFIYAIGGMPGVGKTALAVHIGHQLAAGFPDGQLFLRMHAHTPGVLPIDPADALEYLLKATGVAVDAIPTSSEPQVTLDARAAMWRDRLVGKKLLLIMDDVVGYEQVQPLLPGEPGCLALITSRRRFAARPEVISVPLNTLSPEEAATLFNRLVGQHRRMPEDTTDEEVAQLVQLGGYLPLAISLLAGRLINHPAWSVADLVSDLVAAREKLPYLQADDLAVAATFDLSYRDISVKRRRFFRRLGLSPGTDIDAYAAAALDGISVSLAAEHLDTLHNEYLLIEHVRGRYSMHDMIREYVRTRARSDADRGRDAALTRLLDYYQSAAEIADHQLGKHRFPNAPTARLGTGPDLSSRALAMRWMDTESANIVACAVHCVTYKHDTRVVAFAAALATYLRHSGPWERAIVLHEAAAAAARRQADRLGEAVALTNLGAVQSSTCYYGAATETFSEALQIYLDVGHRLGQADVLTKMGTALYQLDNYPAAAEALDRSLRIYLDLGDSSGQAETLNELGILRFLAGDYRGAAPVLERALHIFRETEDRLGEAWSLNRLGAVRYKTGDYRGARPLLEQALDLYRELGDRVGQSSALNRLGVVATLTGDYPTAFASLRKSLEICDDLGERLGQANTLNNLGRIERLTGDAAGATYTLHRSLDIYREVKNQLGQADALTELGVVGRQIGQYEEAMEALEQALTIYINLGDRQGQAVALNNIGALLHASGQPTEALQRHRSAWELATAVDVPLEMARALDGSSQCRLEMGDRERAIIDLREALAIYHQIGAADAAQAAATLAELVPRPADPKPQPEEN